jgi:hypothetical protein
MQTTRFLPGTYANFFGSLDRFKASKPVRHHLWFFVGGERNCRNFLSKRIVLDRRHMLTRLMIRHDIGCRVEETIQIEDLSKSFFDRLTTTQAMKAPIITPLANCRSSKKRSAPKKLAGISWFCAGGEGQLKTLSINSSVRSGPAGRHSATTAQDVTNRLENRLLGDVGWSVH